MAIKWDEKLDEKKRGWRDRWMDGVCELWQWGRNKANAGILFSPTVI